MEHVNARAAKLLLCDDSPIERMALALFLRQEGYLVDEAGDGATAIDLLKSEPIDAILLDLHMPEKDGFDVLKYLQHHRRGMPVILLSGMPADEIQHEMHRLPNRELPPLFLKPIDPGQLVDVLELQLSGELPGGESRSDTHS